jgi:hypothetical protein
MAAEVTLIGETELCRYALDRPRPREQFAPASNSLADLIGTKPEQIHQR